MENIGTRCCFLFAFFSAFLIIGYEASGCSSNASRKLFVFGDSYADTGNLGKIENISRCWYEPYGMSLPSRRPSGRFSDGKILTDYFAAFLGVKAPVPYKYRKGLSKALYSGMNFAVSGTGVFPTGNLQRDLSMQIDTFEAQINEDVFSNCDVRSSVALVSISGNDYMYFLREGGNRAELPYLTKNVTGQLKLDMKRLRSLGVGKVVVTNLSPVYCTPYVTRDLYYKQCDREREAGVLNHNEQLMRRVKELNGEVNTDHDFLLLDLHTAFLSIIQQGREANKFKQIFKPCCEGKHKESNCGEKDGNGGNQYSLCPNPNEYFYWDSVHPSQAGWAAVFRAILPWLRTHIF